MSNLTGSANFFKYLLFVFNFLFVITGIILLSIGIAVQSVYFGYEHFLEQRFFSVPALLIAIGVIIFIVAAFGCVAAIRENYCMIMAFSVMLFIVFVLELAAGISGYVLRNEAKSLISTTLLQSMELYTKNNSGYDALWDEIQRDFSCCGVESMEDWKAPTGGYVPMSCCTIPVGTLNNFTCSLETIPENERRHGCLSGFGDFIRAHAVSLGAAGVVLAVIQLLGVFVACYIARQVKNRQGLGTM